MYNIELNKIYTNEKVQEALKVLADYCESKGIECLVCDPEKYESEAVDYSFTLPLTFICERSWSLLHAAGNFSHMIHVALFDKEEDPDPYGTPISRVVVSDPDKRGISLWVK